MLRSELAVSGKTCTCDERFILFMKSRNFENILKDAIQNVMGDIIRNILKHQIKDDLNTIIGKIEQIEFDLKSIKSRNNPTIIESNSNQNQSENGGQYKDESRNNGSQEEDGNLLEISDDDNSSSVNQSETEIQEKYLPGKSNITIRVVNSFSF